MINLIERGDLDRKGTRGLKTWAALYVPIWTGSACVCQRKTAPDGAKQAKKTLFKTTARQEREWTKPWNRRPEAFNHQSEFMRKCWMKGQVAGSLVIVIGPSMFTNWPVRSLVKSMGMLRPSWSDFSFILFHLAVCLCFIQFPIYVKNLCRPKFIWFPICFFKFVLKEINIMIVMKHKNSIKNKYQR